MNADAVANHFYEQGRADAMKNSFLWEHHQLQYKEDGIDHLFVDLHSFIRNIMTGDSTINFEVLHELKNSSLNFLYENRNFFYSYNIMKSYLGFAKRDLKQCLINGEFNHNFKKLSHATRCVNSYHMIMNGEYLNDLSKIDNLTYKKMVDLFFLLT